MRWLLLKDLRILRRSPLIVALLVLYPIGVSTLIGLALSRGPDKPRIAFVNQVPESQRTIQLGQEQIDTDRYVTQIFGSIDPVVVSSREEAVEKVRDGDAVGALVIPRDAALNLQSGLEPATVEVIYNAEDPVKARYVRDAIKSRVQDANAALTQKFSEVALGYIDLLVSGGSFSFLGRDFDILGLEKAEQILRDSMRSLPADSPARADLQRVIDFARLARENLDLSDEALASVGQPVRVNQTVIEGDATALSSFAVGLVLTVSLMFVTLLLAAGTLALEREENVFRRLVRGLVSRTGLLVEKIGLAALCSLIVSVLMLLGLMVFVDVDAARLPLTVVALAAAAVAFAAMGTAIGAVAREVRAASLLAFMLSLPLAFLALVPSGAVSGALFDLIRAVSAVFPFRPSLTAIDAALNDGDGFLRALGHLAAVAIGFGLIGRLALRRFA